MAVVAEARQGFPDLHGCSFDRGFYPPANQADLGELLDECALPRKNRLSARVLTRQSQSWFKNVTVSLALSRRSIIWNTVGWTGCVTMAAEYLPAQWRCRYPQPTSSDWAESCATASATNSPTLNDCAPPNILTLPSRTKIRASGDLAVDRIRDFPLLSPRTATIRSESRLLVDPSFNVGQFLLISRSKSRVF